MISDKLRSYIHPGLRHKVTILLSQTLKTQNGVYGLGSKKTNGVYGLGSTRGFYFVVLRVLSAARSGHADRQLVYESMQASGGIKPSH